MRVFGIAFLLPLLFQSPRPAPTPAKTTQEKQQVSSGKKDKAPQDQKPTQQLPSVQKSNAVPTEQRTDNRGNHESQKPSTDWITRFTGILALVAVFQLVAIGLQVYYMREGLKLTRQVAEAATKSLQTVERAAISITIEPKYEVRENVPVKLSFRITNTGHTRAFIKKVWSGTQINDCLPSPEQLLFFVPPENAPTLFDLAPNLSKEFTTEVKALSGGEYASIFISTATLYVRGAVYYDDEFGQRRKTVFCRVYAAGNGPNEGRFIFPDQPGYNYAD